MTFSILDYTDRLQNVEEKGSWLLADCPVCNNHKLKINASTGAYKCYANDCSARKIRDSVARYTPYVKINTRVAHKPVRRFLDAEPLYIPVDILGALENHFVRCARQEDIDRKYYVYNAWQQTVRFITKDGKKIVAPQYLKNDSYVSGTGGMPWFLFNEDWLYEYPASSNSEELKSDIKDKYIMMAEGEKCCVAVTNQAYECLTPAGFCWTLEYLDNAAQRLASYGLQGVLYWQDNDTAGRKKAHMLANACWRNNLQCIVINPSFLRSDSTEEDGFDIADSDFELQDLVLMWVDHNAY